MIKNLIATGLALMLCVGAQAQTPAAYPAKPIKIVKDEKITAE